MCLKSTYRCPNRERLREAAHALGRGETEGYGGAVDVGVGDEDLGTVSPNLMVWRVGRAALQVV